MMCVSITDPLQRWLLQASLRGRREERFLPMGIHRGEEGWSWGVSLTGWALDSLGLPGDNTALPSPREGPAIPARVGERICLSWKSKGALWEGEGAGPYGWSCRAGVHILNVRPCICIVLIL